MQVLSNALAGTNFIHLSFGMMEMMMTASYEQCVIDNEIMGATFRMLKGVEVNDFSLSVDLLRKTGQEDISLIIKKLQNMSGKITGYLKLQTGIHGAHGRQWVQKA